MKPAVTYPDPEALLQPALAELLVAYGFEATCTVGRPEGWTPADGLHVEVAWDGTPEIVSGIVAWPTVRVVVHGSSDRPSATKELALLLCGVLPSAVPSVKVLVGVLAAPDPERPSVHLASFTCRVSTRAQVVEPSGS